MTDILDFATISAKRWHSYQKLGATVASIESLQARIREDSGAECVMLATLKFRDTPDILGFAMFRRTWCNHLALDFLASHPQTLGAIRGVGIALTSFPCLIAQRLDTGALWCETTPASAKRYETWLQTTGVKDVLIVKRPQLDRFLAEQQRSLRKAGLQK